VYVDAYDYIGDSIIGLYFADRFRDRFGIGKITVFSSAHRHLGLFYDSLPVEIRLISEVAGKHGLILLPDLIDNHWGRRLDLLEGLSPSDATAFIIGRNLIVRLGEEPSILHLDFPDPLLRNKNIEDYMDDCLSPFMNPRTGLPGPPPRSSRPFANSFFINGLSSLPERDLPTTMTVDICRRILRSSQSNVIVSRGTPGSSKDRRWVSDFRESMETLSGDASRVRLIATKDLADLGKTIESCHVGAAITADTSIAHLLNRIGVPAITVYKKSFWDSSSIQSLVGSSPLGFCRYGPYQFPAVLKQDADVQTLSELLAQGVSSLASKAHAPLRPTKEALEFVRRVEQLNSNRRNLVLSGDLIELHRALLEKNSILKKNSGRNQEWIFDIYDPRDMLADVLRRYPMEKVTFLFKSCWMVSPAYKYINGVSLGQAEAFPCKGEDA
jgi:hypothetical protein